MEIKASLAKPYTNTQRMDFIVEQNHRNGYMIKETDSALEAWGYTEEELAKQRKATFLESFFKVGNYGYYRRQPKGYQSAVESMNVLFNIANVTQGLQAGLIIFYEEPDFTKPEECTEEWLVEHQIVMPAMTLQEFLALYVEFMTAWNTEEHVSLEEEQQEAVVEEEPKSEQEESEEEQTEEPEQEESEEE